MGQLAAAVEAEAREVAPKVVLTPEEKEELRKARHAATRLKLTNNSRLRYARAFMNPASTPEGGRVLGRSNLACYIQLCRYEKLGLVKRVGHAFRGYGTAALVWQWIGEQEISILNGELSTDDLAIAKY